MPASLLCCPSSFCLSELLVLPLFIFIFGLFNDRGSSFQKETMEPQTTYVLSSPTQKLHPCRHPKSSLGPGTEAIRCQIILRNHSFNLIDCSCGGGRRTMAAKLRWVMQLHRDVPRAARFYSEGLDFTIDVCSLRWAELHSGPLSLALLHSPSEHLIEKRYSSLLSFTVPDMNITVTKLMALGAELDGPIKHEIHGKVAAVRCLDGHMIGLYEPI